MNLLLINALCALPIAQPTVLPPTPEKAAIRAVVKANTEFAVDLHLQLRGQPGNLCYSPWSISTVLAMTSAGAQGRTLDQMTKTLHLPEAQLTHPGMAALLRQMVARGYLRVNPA